MPVLYTRATVYIHRMCMPRSSAKLRRVSVNQRDVCMYPFSLQADDADYEAICSSCLFLFNFSLTAS